MWGWRDDTFLNAPQGVPKTTLRNGLVLSLQARENSYMEPLQRGPVDFEMLVGGEWAEWYRLTPAERWAETEKLWQAYLEMGGMLDPEPDPQSPFFDAEEWREIALDGRPGLRAVRRSGV